MLARPLVLLLLLAAPLASAAEVRVSAQNGVFAPDVIEARPGDTVVFVNDDGRAHTVTSAWDDGASFHAILKPGESFSYVFAEEGEYAIRCVPHSTSAEGGHEGMVATVRVATAAAAPEQEARSPLLMAGIALVALAGLAVAFFTVKRAFPAGASRRALR